MGACVVNLWGFHVHAAAGLSAQSACLDPPRPLVVASPWHGHLFRTFRVVDSGRRNIESVLAAGIQTPQPESGGHAADQDGWRLDGQSPTTWSMQWMDGERDRQKPLPVPCGISSLPGQGLLAAPASPSAKIHTYEGALRSFPCHSTSLLRMQCIVHRMQESPLLCIVPLTTRSWKSRILHVRAQVAGWYLPLSLIQPVKLERESWAGF
ncbi:hypothetical protein HDV57DRAFT_125986 [Trichoderma longibrachiatum]|uniref:Uncharacterized protein n=1 Tax=Trichoderma longibrachiatum ATCC 18648 TaxID=983965 RepID=A0A2T4BRR6_TRILO|nr:hypothetical protein M440DRAFT_171913 [Trichoderma longibrachiatum ATCC 18648]